MHPLFFSVSDTPSESNKHIYECHIRPRRGIKRSGEPFLNIF